jgi:hypothetical protein
MRQHPICLYTIPRSGEVPTEFVSGIPDDIDNVQEFLEYLLTLVGLSASPGFTWGRSGNIVAGAWLLNDTVPSDRTGRTVFIYNGEAVQLFTSNEDISTYQLGLYEFDKNTSTYTQIAVIDVTNEYSNEVDLTDVYVTKGLELGIKVESGSGKNITCGVLMKGTLEP